MCVFDGLQVDVVVSDLVVDSHLVYQGDKVPKKRLEGKEAKGGG